MAKSDLLNSISSLSRKIDGLINERNKLLERLKALEDENSELKKQHLRDNSALDKALRDAEFLSLSHRLASSPEDLMEARKKISKLLRTIDSCIRILKEN